MTNLRDFKRNKALKRDLTYLISEFENIKLKLKKYNIYKEVIGIINHVDNGIIKYNKILGNINE